MKNTLVFAAALTVAGIASGASANATTTSHAGKNDCVFTSAINDFKPLDRNKMVIYGPGRKAYLVELSMPLPELKFPGADAIRFRPMMKLPQLLQLAEQRRYSPGTE